MRLPTHPLLTLLLAYSSFAAAVCQPPFFGDPSSGAIYVQTPTGFPINGGSNTPGCNSFTLRIFNAASGSQITSSSFTTDPNNRRFSNVITLPPGQYYATMSVQGFTSDTAQSSLTSTQPFSVRGAVCDTPQITGPSNGAVIRNSSPLVAVTVSSLVCDRFELILTKVGTTIAQITTLSKQSGSSAFTYTAMASSFGDYDITVRGLDPSGRQITSPSSHPVRVTLASIQCATPTLITPATNDQIFRNFPPSFTAEVSSTDCRDLLLAVYNLDTNTAVGDFALQVAVGQTTVRRSFTLPVGRYSVQARASNQDGGRTSSIPSVARSFVITDLQCSLPTLNSPTNGSTFQITPTGFNYVVSSTDCRTLRIVAAQVGTKLSYESTTTLAVGQQSLAGLLAVPPGLYQVFVWSSDSARITSNTLGGTFITVLRVQCPIPTLDHPTQGERFQTLPGADHAPTQYDLTTSSPCTSITVITIASDGSVLPLELADSTHYSQVRNSPPGVYKVSAIARDPSGDMADSAAVPDRTFYVDPSACDTPTIISPTVDQRIPYPDGSFVYTASYGNCRRLSLYLNGVFQVVREPSASLSSYSENGRLDPGRYEAYITAEDIPSTPDGPRRPTARSPTVVFYIEDVNILCTAPTIITPANPPYPALTGQRPTVSGTTTAQDKCTKVAFYFVNGNGLEVFLGSGPRGAGNTFSVQATEQMAVGTYVIYARSLALGSNVVGVKSNEVTILVGADAPVPTGNFGSQGRRRVQCKKGEDLCPHLDIRGRKLMICVPSLASNLEQCGSCGGPDCTMLPNADDVTCAKGNCLVTSCLEGYALQHNTCVAASKGLTLHVQPLARRFRTSSR